MLTRERLLRTSDTLPADLRRWLGRSGLVGSALEAVQTVNWGVYPVTDAAQEFRPQMMLTLLSYCYAAGICGSQDIAWAAQSDKTVRYICAGKEPDWLTIRRFRRRNVELLRQCLAYILKQAWTLRVAGESSSEPIIDRSEPNLDQQVADAVRNRIDTAVFLDAVANDC
ncbi:MAG: transposase [Verrucomicrobiota bacterium]